MDEFMSWGDEVCLYQCPEEEIPMDIEPNEEVTQ